MALTPQIALTVNLLDVEGEQIGSVGSPAYVRVALCNYGQFLPRIPGTGMIGQVVTGVGEYTYEGEALELTLWGNDVLVPVGTYYTITILDANKNIIQTGAYVFTGTFAADLSSLSPTFPSYSPSIMGALVTVPFAASESFDCTLVNGPIAFDLTLTADVTASVIVSPFAGQIVTFILSQDGTGGHAFTWPTNAMNTSPINNTANSVTTQTFIARANGNLYPIGPPIYS